MGPVRRAARFRSREAVLSTIVVETVSVVALLLVLAFAVTRPRGLPEAVAAVPAAGLVVAIGAVSPHEAWARTRDLLPVVGFLAAVLVLAQLCDEEGLFTAAGDLVARSSAASSAPTCPRAPRRWKGRQPGHGCRCSRSWCRSSRSPGSS